MSKDQFEIAILAGDGIGTEMPARLAMLQVPVYDRDLCSTPRHSDAEEIRYRRCVKDGSGVIRVHRRPAHPLLRRQG